jgi:hypothetical protein
MKVYIAGKMRGLPEFGFPIFDAAERILMALGYECVSPASMDRDEGFDAAGKTGITLDGFNVYEALKRDFIAIMECDGIVLLPGWENSSGAQAEKVVATSTGKKVMTYTEAVEEGQKRQKGRKLRGVVSAAH